MFVEVIPLNAIQDCPYVNLTQKKLELGAYCLSKSLTVTFIVLQYSFADC